MNTKSESVQTQRLFLTRVLQALPLPYITQRYITTESAVSEATNLRPADVKAQIRTESAFSLCRMTISVFHHHPRTCHRLFC